MAAGREHFDIDGAAVDVHKHRTHAMIKALPMRHSHRIWLILLCLCVGSLRGAFPGLRYLGDIGDLGIPGNPRTSVRIEKIQAVWADDHIRFQGRDDDGKSWQAVLPVAQGLGYSAVWQADFDNNSRRDLMIASYSSKSGRCTDAVTLSFLLFNDHGQPVPWVIETRAPSFRVPAIFADLNNDGRAELVVTDCTYRYPGTGVDRRITGIYEAKNASWSLIKPDHMEPYSGLMRRNHRFNAQVHLLPAGPGEWPDQGNQTGSDGQSPVQVTQVVKASENCRGVRLPPIVNGELQPNWKDPCDEMGHNRIQLSDGTICYDWPTVMLDGEDGRKIVADSENPEMLLRKIIEQRRKVVLAGQRNVKRCSPILLWAFRDR